MTIFTGFKEKAKTKKSKHMTQVDSRIIAPKKASLGNEIGGSKGLDPTRYGDWEKSGRCIDF